MKYYPVNLNLCECLCLVVGGGTVGVRKVDMLLKCGAKVIVVSPKVNSKMLKLHKRGLIKLKLKKYDLLDLCDCFLVIGATNNAVINDKISKDAFSKNIFCNIVDNPEKCNFILPSIINRGDFIVTFSTSGTSPAFAKKVRKEMENYFGPEYALLLRLMKSVRSKLLAISSDSKVNKRIFEKILDGDILNLIKKGNIEKINSILNMTLGSGFSYEKLIK